MPRSLFYLPFIIVSVCFPVQESFSQSRYGVALDSNKITTLSSKTGILYRGIDNYIQIAPFLQAKYDTILVVSNNGKVFYEKDNTLLVIPSRLGKIRLMLTGISGNDTISLGYSCFAVQGVPEPRLTIDDIPINTHCIIPKRALIDCDSLGIYFSQDIVGSEKWLKVTRFILGYSYGGFFVSHINPSNVFSKETKIIINQIGPDREIGILAIVEGEGELTKKLPVYKITIY